MAENNLNEKTYKDINKKNIYKKQIDEFNDEKKESYNAEEVKFFL